MAANNSQLTQPVNDHPYIGPNVPVLSFFTGAGFLDIGFIQAGFDIICIMKIIPILCGHSSWAQGEKVGF